MKGLDIYDDSGEGYRRMVAFGGWRVACISHSDFFAEKSLRRMERHLLTDEVFVLLEGDAQLVVGLPAERVTMARGRIYNVRKGVWHNVITHPGARILVVENAETGPENGEYRELAKGELK